MAIGSVLRRVVIGEDEWQAGSPTCRGLMAREDRTGVLRFDQLRQVLFCAVVTFNFQTLIAPEF